MVTVMAYLSACYPRQAVSPETMAVYAEHLAGRNYDDVMAMARDHVARSAFFPTIAELIPPPAPKPERQGISPPRATEYPASSFGAGWPRAIRKQLERIGNGGTYTPPTIDDARREQASGE